MELNNETIAGLYEKVASMTPRELDALQSEVQAKISEGRDRMHYSIKEITERTTGNKDTSRPVDDRTIINGELRDELELAQAKINALLDTIPYMAWFKAKDGLHKEVNTEFSKTVGKSKKQCYDKTHGYIWDVDEDNLPDDVKCVSSETDVMMAGKTLATDELLHTKKGDRELRTYKSPIYVDGELWGTVGVGVDVTNFENMGLQLSLLLNSVPYPAALFDRNWKNIRDNDAYRNLTGRGRRDYLTWKKKNLVPNEGEFILKGSDRRSFMLQENDVIDYFGRPNGHLCIFIETTAQRRYEEQLKYLVERDSMTGLYNRSYLYEHAEEYGWLIYRDIDDFKTVNDTQGHEAGDRAIKKVADTLKKHFHGALVARLGGDEFAVLVKDEKEIKKMNRLDFGRLSVSWGAAKITGNNFMHDADTKMYDMKKQRKLALLKARCQGA